MKKKFWHHGCNFQCQHCGNCCSFPNGVIYASKNEMQKIADFLKIDFNEFLNRFTIIDQQIIAIKSKADGPCVFYENSRCTVYEQRPTQCKTYPFWPEIMKNETRWQNESRKCAGINNGRFWTKDEIAETLKMNHEEYYLKVENS